MAIPTRVYGCSPASDATWFRLPQTANVTCTASNSSAAVQQCSIGKVVLFTSAGSAFVSFTRTFMVTVAAAAGGAVSLARRVGKGVAAASGSRVSYSREVGLSITVVGEGAARIFKQMFEEFLVSSSGNAVIKAFAFAISARLASVRDGMNRGLTVATSLKGRLQGRLAAAVRALRR